MLVGKSSGFIQVRNKERKREQIAATREVLEKFGQEQPGDSQLIITQEDIDSIIRSLETVALFDDPEEQGIALIEQLAQAVEIGALTPENYARIVAAAGLEIGKVAEKQGASGPVSSPAQPSKAVTSMLNKAADLAIRAGSSLKEVMTAVTAELASEEGATPDSVATALKAIPAFQTVDEGTKNASISSGFAQSDSCLKSDSQSPSEDSFCERINVRQEMLDLSRTVLTDSALSQNEVDQIIEEMKGTEISENNETQLQVLVDQFVSGLDQSQVAARQSPVLAFDLLHASAALLPDSASQDRVANSLVDQLIQNGISQSVILESYLLSLQKESSLTESEMRSALDVPLFANFERNLIEETVQKLLAEQRLPTQSEFTISSLLDLETSEDSETTEIPVKISATQSDVLCSSIEWDSSNLTLLPNENITITGTAPNCLLTLTPAPDQFGTAEISLTLSDGELQALQTFKLNVTNVNDAPVLADISEQVTNEDIPKEDVSVWLTDSDSVISCASLSAISSNEILLPLENITFSGTAPDCKARLTPAENLSGTALISITASDGELSDDVSFQLTVLSQNDAPIVFPIENQSTLEESPLSGISVSILDVDSPISCEDITASSSQETLLPNANITITGAAPNCLLALTPAPDQFGTAEISLTLSDGELQALQTFELNVTNVNDAPVLADISEQVTNEDLPKEDVSVWLTDSDSVISCSSLSASSSDEILLPVQNITFSGTAPDCKAQLTPAENLAGTALISITASDGEFSDDVSFQLTVMSQNDAPTISPIEDQSTSEESPLSDISVTILDVDSTVSCEDITASSSQETLLPNANITVSGTAPNCLLALTPAADQFGTAEISLTLSDGKLQALQTFELNVTNVNNAPTLSAVPDQLTEQDIPLADIEVSISDIDSSLNCASLTALSSNQSILRHEDISFTGLAPSCLMALAPVSGQTGASEVTLMVSDGDLSASRVFQFTVVEANSPPTISAVADQTTPEDSPITGLAVTIDDADGPLSCSAISGSSSDPGVLRSASIELSGSYPNCQLSLTPEENVSGSATVTLTVFDGLAEAVESFLLTVTPENDAPTLSDVANQNINEDSSVTGLNVTIDDIDSTLTCGSLSGLSSNTALLPHANITFGGSYPDCTVDMTPLSNQSGSTTVTLTVTDGSLTATDTLTLSVAAQNDAPAISNIPNQNTNEDTPLSNISVTISDIDNSLSCSTALSGSSTDTSLLPNGSITFSGTAPDCLMALNPATDQHGSTTVTVTVSDGSLTDSDSFSLNVSPVNDAPTISDVANQSINEDSSVTGLNVTIGDIDSTLTCGSLSGSSSNTALLPHGNITFGGSYPNCTVNMTPPSNQSGSTTVTLTVTDGSLNATDTLTLSVTAQNDAPTISNISNQNTNEDTPLSNISVTISDIDNSLSCSAALSGSSTNTSLLPNHRITFSGTAPNCFMALNPASNQHGSTTVTVTVSDGSLTDSDSFSLNVSPVNDAPTISNVANQNINEDSSVSGLSVIIGDVDSTLTCGSLSGSSSNTSLLPSSNITFGGSYPNCTINMTPLSNQSGSTTVTLTVTDGSRTATDTLTLSVAAQNDAPTISNISNQSTNEDTPLSNVSVTISDIDNSLTCSALSGTSTNTSLLPNGSITFSGTAPNCLMNLTPEPNEHGSSTVTVTVSDGSLNDSDSFSFTVNSVNDAPIVSLPGNPSVPVSSLGSISAEPTQLVTIDFLLTDIDTSLGSCSAANSLTTSSMVSVLPVSQVSVSGTAPNCVAEIRRRSSPAGSSTLTLHFSDGSASTSVSITYTGVNTSYAATQDSVGGSGQRRSFYDPTTALHWAFSYEEYSSQGRLRVDTSTDGSEWTLLGCGRHLMFDYL